MCAFTIPVPVSGATSSSTSISGLRTTTYYTSRRRALCASLASPPRRPASNSAHELNDPTSPLPPQPSLRRPTSTAVTELSDLASLLAFIADGHSSLLCVEVWSKSCRACLGMKRTYERVAEAHDHLDVKFGRICVDDVEDVRKHLNVRAMPLFVFYKDGGRIDHFASASRETLERSISDNL